MIARRIVLSGVLIVLAVVLEVTLLAPLPFPGATPPLVLVVVAALAFAFGPTAGAISGFAAGLLLDVAPPAAGTVGISALLLTVAGYLLARVGDPYDRPLVLSVGSTAAASTVVVLAGAALGGLLGDPRVQWGEVPVMMITSFLYAAMLALVLVPLVGSLARRFVPEAFGR